MLIRTLEYSSERIITAGVEQRSTLQVDTSAHDLEIPGEKTFFVSLKVIALQIPTFPKRLVQAVLSFLMLLDACYLELHHTKFFSYLPICFFTFYRLRPFLTFQGFNLKASD